MRESRSAKCRHLAAAGIPAAGGFSGGPTCIARAAADFDLWPIPLFVASDALAAT